MRVSSMASMMLYRTLVVFTLIITGVINALPNPYQNRRSGDISQGNEVSSEIEEKFNPSLRREEIKMCHRKKRKFPLFPSLTICQGKEYKRKEISPVTSESEDIFALCNFLLLRNMKAANGLKNAAAGILVFHCKY